MNVKNLSLKFGSLAILVAICIYFYEANGIKQGIDLRGGHSITLQIRTPEIENEQLKANRNELQAKLSIATGEEKRKIETAIKDLTSQIDANSKVDSATLADRIIAILKKRLDPHGIYSLEFRPVGVGKSRIEIRMPAGQEGSSNSQLAYTRLLAEVQEHNIQRSQVRNLEQASPAQRPKLIQEIAGNDSLQAHRLQELAKAYDKMQRLSGQIPELQRKVREAEKAASATTPSTQPAQHPLVIAARKGLSAAKDDLVNTEAQYESYKQQVEQGNVNTAELQNILRTYVSKAEAKALGQSTPDELKRRQRLYKEDLGTFYAKYSGRKDEIAKVVQAYEDWSNVRKRLDDPSDLLRLIRKSGVLEFRMAPYGPGTGESFSLSVEERDRYLQELTREGPDAGRRRNAPFLWFPIHGDPDKYTKLITADYNGRRYVLLYNQPDYEMLNPPGAPKWSLREARRGTDRMNLPAVDFAFDPRGANIFSKMTSNNIQHDMAILLDDEVYSAPVIQSTIGERGQITGSFTEQEVMELVNTFEAGSLPARLDPSPVAISTFGSAMGDINKKMSLKAGYIALISVAVFMLGYYLLSGVIADLALGLNIILIFGAMTAFGAVFTMPGIAGLILTVGMAVDSNVLINERLREEQDKGLAIRMAFKNAYERAFSAIFDSHLTALITCIVLYWVGTEEIKGFALTLGLGVAFNLFTAVFVTKWVVQIMLNTGMIRSHQYMLRLIHVPKIDWMAKRYYFWGFSLVTAVLGVVALISEGGRIWGIEFSGGTQATLIFKPDALIRDADGKRILANDLDVAQAFHRTVAGFVDGGSVVDGKHVDLTNLKDNVRFETVIDPDQADKFFRKYAPQYNPTRNDNKITLAQWNAQGSDIEYFKLLDANHDGTLDFTEVQKRPSEAYKLNTTEKNVPLISAVSRYSFGGALANRVRLSYDLATGQAYEGQLGIALDPKGKTLIKPSFKQTARPEYRDEFYNFEGGLLVVVDHVQPAVTRAEIEQRFDSMRLQPDEALASLATNPTKVIGLTPGAGQTFKSFAILVRPTEGSLTGDTWTKFADDEARLVNEVMQREEAMTAINFDAAVARQAQQLALIAVTVSWIAIIAYLWLRFGSISWGLAAVICLIHDSIIVVGMVAVSDWISRTSIGQSLLVGSFKIDLAMVAAVLTIIGYSVSDTIVVFDRIRENRGKLKTVSAQVINASINQTLSRTILTVFTVFIVVFVMYVWAGESIRGFNYALLVGIFFGCYSSIAVAAPILLGFKQMVIGRGLAASAPPTPAAK